MCAVVGRSVRTLGGKCGCSFGLLELLGLGSSTVRGSVGRFRVT
jgi:hypothetical protein